MEQSKLTCDCGFIGSSIYEYDKHQRTNHQTTTKIILGQSETVQVARKDGLFHCPSCDYSSSYSKTIWSHVRTCYHRNAASVSGLELVGEEIWQNDQLASLNLGQS